VVVFFAMSLPKPELIRHSQVLYDQLAPESKTKILSIRDSIHVLSRRKYELREEALRRGLITEVKMPNGCIMAFSREIQEKEREDVVNEYWSIVEKSTKEQRMSHVGLAFVWWVLPVLALYLFGWSVGWVYRGFKK
jgi:hypothetical protein